MTTLKEALAQHLTAKQLDLVRTSFDVIGDVAIIEVPYGLKHKTKLIAQTLHTLLPKLRTIAVKEGGHRGKHRTQNLRVIVGDKNVETTHKENGVILHLNVQTCYYSPRMGTERMRIASQVKKGERILVVGSGIGPYPLVLAKHSPAVHITAVETNANAHAYAQKNLLANKLGSKITLAKADIARVNLDKTFDRIISVIPHKGVAIAKNILRFAKKGTILQLYDFAPETDLHKPARKLETLCKKEGISCTILNVRKAGQHAVRSYRVCVEATVC